MRRLLAPLLCVAMALSLSACGSDSKTKTITKSDFTGQYSYPEKSWPWDSNTTKVECHDHDAVTIEIDGTVYPLNGLAKDWHLSDNDLRDVWLDDPDVSGSKIDASDYNHIALGFCGIDAPALD